MHKIFQVAREHNLLDLWFEQLDCQALLFAGRELAVLEELLSAVKAYSILDVGCGSGIHLQKLKRRTDLHVTGIEPEQSFAEKTKCFYPELDGDIITVRAEDHKTESGYDCLHARYVLQYVEDPMTFCLALRKLTKPGGIFVATEPCLPTYSRDFKASRVLKLQEEFRKRFQIAPALDDRSIHLHAIEQAGFSLRRDQEVRIDLSTKEEKILYVEGVKRAARIRALCMDLPSVQFFDLENELEELYRDDLVISVMTRLTAYDAV